MSEPSKTLVIIFS